MEWLRRRSWRYSTETQSLESNVRGEIVPAPRQDTIRDSDDSAGDIGIKLPSAEDHSYDGIRKHEDNNYFQDSEDSIDEFDKIVADPIQRNKPGRPKGAKNKNPLPPRIRYPPLSQLELGLFDEGSVYDSEKPLSEAVVEYFKNAADISVNKVFFDLDEFEHAVWAYNVIAKNVPVFRFSHSLWKMNEKTRVWMYCQDKDCEYKVLARLHMETVNELAPLYVITESEPHSMLCKGIEHSKLSGMTQDLPAEYNKLDLKTQMNIRKSRDRAVRDAEQRRIQQMKEFKDAMEGWINAGRKPGQEPQMPAEQPVKNVPKQGEKLHDYQLRLLSTKRVQYLYRMIPDSLTLSAKRESLVDLLSAIFPSYSHSYFVELERRAFQDYYKFGNDSPTDNFGALYVLSAYLKCFDEENGITIFTERSKKDHGIVVEMCHLVDKSSSSESERGGLKFKKPKSREIAKDLVALAYEECVVDKKAARQQEVGEAKAHLVLMQPIEHVNLISSKLEQPNYQELIRRYEISSKKLKKAIELLFDELEIETALEALESNNRYIFDAVSNDDREVVTSRAGTPSRSVQSSPSKSRLSSPSKSQASPIKKQYLRSARVERLPDTAPSERTRMFDWPVYPKMLEHKLGFSQETMMKWVSRVREAFDDKVAHGVFVATRSMRIMSRVVKNEWYLVAEPSTATHSSESEPSNSSSGVYYYYTCYAYDSNKNKTVLAVGHFPTPGFSTWCRFLKALRFHYKCDEKQTVFCSTGENGVVPALNTVFPGNSQRLCAYHVARAIASEQQPTKWRHSSDADESTARGRFWKMVCEPSLERSSQIKSQFKKGRLTSHFMQNPERFCGHGDVVSVMDPVLDNEVRSLPMPSAILRICDEQASKVRQDYNTQVNQSLVKLENGRVLTRGASMHLRRILSTDQEDHCASSDDLAQGNYYTFDLEKGTCSCGEELQRNGMPCRHVMEAAGDDSRKKYAHIQDWNYDDVLRDACVSATKHRSFYYMDFAFAMMLLAEQMAGCLALPPHWPVRRLRGEAHKRKRKVQKRNGKANDDSGQVSKARRTG